MSDRVCEWPGCDRLASPSVDVHGKWYCGPHYFPGLERAFLEEYAAWDGVREPTDKFKNLFSRYIEALCPVGGMPGKLSQDRIEKLGTTWKKTPVGLEFSIQHHLSGRRWGRSGNTISQEWRFNLQTKELVLVE